jgi:hypothetical protein
MRINEAGNHFAEKEVRKDGNMSDLLLGSEGQLDLSPMGVGHPSIIGLFLFRKGLMIPGQCPGEDVSVDLHTHAQIGDLRKHVDCLSFLSFLQEF